MKFHAYDFSFFQFVHLILIKIPCVRNVNLCNKLCRLINKLIIKMIRYYSVCAELLSWFKIAFKVTARKVWEPLLQDGGTLAIS